MPYKNLNEIPESVRSLPLEAQRVYVAAYNCAWEQYHSLADDENQQQRREKADEVAWNAVTGAYTKDEQNNTWQPKV